MQDSEASDWDWRSLASELSGPAFVETCCCFANARNAQDDIFEVQKELSTCGTIHEDSVLDLTRKWMWRQYDVAEEMLKQVPEDVHRLEGLRACFNFWLRLRCAVALPFVPPALITVRV